MFNPICEVSTALPMNFDIHQLEAEFKPPERLKKVEKPLEPRDFLNKPNTTWTVLPIFKYHLDHLKPTFSYRYNQYMRCKYNHFLDNVPDMFVTVLPFDVNKNRYVWHLVEIFNSVNLFRFPFDFRTPKPRRKSLTGQFYGVDFKLAPVPVSKEYK